MNPTRAVLERIAMALEAQQQGRPVMDVEETARYLRVSPNTIYNLVEQYGLKVYRLTANGCVRFRKEDLDEWVKTRRVATPDEHRQVRRGRVGRPRTRLMHLMDPAPVEEPLAGGAT